MLQIRRGLDPLLLRDGDLIVGRDVRPRHPHHVGPTLPRVQKQFEGQALFGT